jgi:hypothetical protein
MSASTTADFYADEGPYVAGWQRNGSGDDTTYGHDGSNTLWYARAVLQPARNRAFLIATNTGEAKGLAAIEDLTVQLLPS